MRLSCDPNEILWYAMSSPFRREMKAKALLDAHHIENFIPMKKRQEIRDGEIVTWEEPAIHNFVFVHDSYNGIMKVKKGLDILQFILNPLSPIVVPQRRPFARCLCYAARFLGEMPMFASIRSLMDLSPSYSK